MSGERWVREISRSQRKWLAGHLERAWGGREVVSRGRLRDASRLPALVCLQDGQIAGVATYERRDGELELVTLDALRPWQGVGSALLAAVKHEVQRASARRLWLVTTNDNLAALRFYQRRGLRLVAVHPGAVEQARQLKPQIPASGHFAIPVRDEIELEWRPLRAGDAWRRSQNASGRSF